MTVRGDLTVRSCRVVNRAGKAGKRVVFRKKLENIYLIHYGQLEKLEKYFLELDIFIEICLCDNMFVIEICLCDNMFVIEICLCDNMFL